jgi:HopJ type III effector protein
MLTAHTARSHTCRFKNGSLDNAAGTNEGSCKVFSFGRLTSKSEQETLELFAQHYKSVLSTPQGKAIVHLL